MPRPGPPRGSRRTLRHVLTPGYLLYLALLLAGAIGLGRHLLSAWRPPTLADMARDDYRNREGHMLRKIDRDRLLHDLAPDVTTMRHGVEYGTNGAGMRDDREYAVTKPPDTRRIIFLGDSFTFGWGLELEFTFVKQLDRRLARDAESFGPWEVLNLGVPGYNTIAEVASLEEKGLRYDPDVVILMYHLNDAESSQQTRLGIGPETHRRLVAYFAGEAPVGEAAEIEAFLTEQDLLADAEVVRRDVERLPPQHRGALHVSHAVAHHLALYWDPVETALSRLATLASEHDFVVIAGIIPALDISWEVYPYWSMHEKVADAMRRRGFEVVDFTEAFSRHPHRPDLQLWGHDGHTSAFANAIIAELLAEPLTRLCGVAGALCGDGWRTRPDVAAVVRQPSDRA